MPASDRAIACNLVLHNAVVCTAAVIDRATVDWKDQTVTVVVQAYLSTAALDAGAEPVTTRGLVWSIAEIEIGSGQSLPITQLLGPFVQAALTS